MVVRAEIQVEIQVEIQAEIPAAIQVVGDQVVTQEAVDQVPQVPCPTHRHPQESPFEASKVHPRLMEYRNTSTDILLTLNESSEDIMQMT